MSPTDSPLLSIRRYKENSSDELENKGILNMCRFSIKKAIPDIQK